MSSGPGLNKRKKVNWAPVFTSPLADRRYSVSNCSFLPCGIEPSHCDPNKPIFLLLFLLSALSHQWGKIASPALFCLWGVREGQSDSTETYSSTDRHSRIPLKTHQSHRRSQGQWHAGKWRKLFPGLSVNLSKCREYQFQMIAVVFMHPKSLKHHFAESKLIEHHLAVTQPQAGGVEIRQRLVLWLLKDWRYYCDQRIQGSSYCAPQCPTFVQEESWEPQRDRWNQEQWEHFESEHLGLGRC